MKYTEKVKNKAFHIIMESKAEYQLRALIHMLWYENTLGQGHTLAQKQECGVGGTWIKIWVGEQSFS